MVHLLHRIYGVDAPEVHGNLQVNQKILYTVCITGIETVIVCAQRGCLCTCEDVAKRWKVARHCEDSRRCRCHTTTRSRSYDWVYTRSYIAPASEAQSPRHGFVVDLLQQAIQQIHNRSVWWSLGFRRWLQLRSDFDSNGRRIVM